MNLRLHQLQALVAVVDQGGIRAAARHMHLSQAALTKSLRQLEDDAGQALLQRSSRGVHLTEAGQRLLVRARLVTQQLALAEAELQAQGDDWAGELHVALTPYLIMTHLGAAFRWFRQRHPRVAVEVAEGLAARVVPRLRDGSLDLAIVADMGDLPTGEFHMERLCTVAQHLVVRADHPVRAQPTPQALVALEWVITGPQDGFRTARVERLFAQAGLGRPSRILHADTLAALALLRSTDVISLVPAPILAQPEGRGLVALHPPGLRAEPFDLVLLSRPEVPLTPAAAYFARCLRDELSAAPSA